MLVSDAVLLSTVVDGVVLVVNSQQTPKDVAREACARLTYARAKILGVVLNRVDLRSGNYAYYYGSYAS
jgi:Mrp family chromosome partitioning ATPase